MNILSEDVSRRLHEAFRNSKFSDDCSIGNPEDDRVRFAFDAPEAREFLLEANEAMLQALYDNDASVMYQMDKESQFFLLPPIDDIPKVIQDGVQEILIVLPFKNAEKLGLATVLPEVAPHKTAVTYMAEAAKGVH